MSLFFYPIFKTEHLLFPFSLTPFDICSKYPKLWSLIKISYKISFFVVSFIFFNNLFSHLFSSKISKSTFKNSLTAPDGLFLYVGNNYKTNEKIFISDKGLFQNVLVTGTIGSGKTSSVLYPFVNQLIAYASNCSSEKLGMLILDVKGNFYKKVKEFAINNNREDDLVIIEIRFFGKI